MLIGWGLGAVVSLVLLLPPALGVIDGQILMLEHVRSSAIAPLGIMMDVMSRLTRKFGPEAQSGHRRQRPEGGLPACGGSKTSISIS
jgi:hypothetical protein